MGRRALDGIAVVGAAGGDIRAGPWGDRGPGQNAHSPPGWAGCAGSGQTARDQKRTFTLIHRLRALSLLL